MGINNITDKDICGICLDDIVNPYQLNCNHVFCKSCIQDYKNSINKDKYIDPCIYGAPRCPCNNNSCINRPCCNSDTVIMKEWEDKSPFEYREWTIDESTLSKNYKRLFYCPLCREII